MPSSPPPPPSARTGSMLLPVAYAAAAAGSGSGSGLLTGLVAQLWSHLNVALSASVKAAVEPTFQKTLPGPLSTLRFTRLDLGRVPLRLDNIVVHEKTSDSDSGSSRVQFDMDILWDGDCQIELKADYVGSFGVKQVKLKGRMSVVLGPLTHELPVVSAVQYGFINPPFLSLDFTGLANVADMSVIDDKIRQAIQDVLGGMMVLPNRMLSKMDPTSSFMDIYKPPVGVVRVTVDQGYNFEPTKKARIMHDVHDIYCTLQLGNETQWRTSTINNCEEPKWNESTDFLLFDYDQVIRVKAWDEDVGNADDDLGSAQVTVGEMLLAGKRMNIDLHGGGSQKGGAVVTLRCDVCTLTPHNLDSLDKNRDANLLSGLLTILVTRATNIPLEKKEASCFVKVKYGSSPQQEFVTGKVVDAPGVDALNPIFDSVFHVPLKPEHMASKASIVLELVTGEDTVLGTTTVTHADLLQAQDKTVTEQRAVGDQGASLEFCVSLRGVEQPVVRTGATDSVDAAAAALASSSFVTSQNAIGRVRLTVAKGWGFEVEKKRFRRNDVPDVYCNITFGSSPKVWKTGTVRNSTTPEWNESADYLLSDHGQMISLSVFDEDKRRDADDYLGGTRITVGKLLLAGGLKDVELEKAGKPTGLFVSLRCDMGGPLE